MKKMKYTHAIKMKFSDNVFESTDAENEIVDLFNKLTNDGKIMGWDWDQ